MDLRELTKPELEQLYHTEMKRAFPPTELKPLSAMEALRDKGCYQPLGLFDGEELLGYGLMWLAPGIPFVLMDYLGTLEGKRNRGLGSVMLDKLAEFYRDYRGVFGEAEGAFSQDPEQAALQRRRLGFYERNGFRYGGYDCALFSVHYRTLIRSEEKVTQEELMAAHQAIYRTHLPKEIYTRFIQIPLAEGEQPHPAAAWAEE